MIVVRSFDELTNDPNSVVTVGTFDGVHLAHKEIVREVVHRARMREGRSVVVTFDPHPKEVVTSQRGPVSLLTTIEERLEQFSVLGVELLYIINFTYEFSRQSSEEFYRRYLIDGTGVSEVVVGYDHMFGRDREGKTGELVTMGKQYDFSVFAMHPFTVDGQVVSSTQIRKSLAAGDIERANKFLGREYSLRGTVVRGDERGRTIAFPTANILPDSGKKMVPLNGVYFVGVTVREQTYFGMMNIGVRPTVSDASRRTLEVHLFDFNGDIYGEKITVRFISKLRDEQKFASLEELTRQLGHDREESLKLIAGQQERQ